MANSGCDDSNEETVTLILPNGKELRFEHASSPASRRRTRRKFARLYRKGPWSRPYSPAQ
jgi:hypothetical protein